MSKIAGASTKMPDYQQGKIYKISANEIDAVYIGSTTKKTLAMRMGRHRSDYKLWKAGASNRLTSFDILKYPSAVITLIELFPCKTKDELNDRERYHIEKNVCVNKMRNLNRTPDEKKAYDANYQKEQADKLKKASKLKKKV